MFKAIIENNLFAFTFVLALTLIPQNALAEDASKLMDLSLEELLQVKIVTSASKKEEKLLEVSSAVYILTHEDIERSGATSIPEVLRIVPGVQVAKVSNTSYAVSIRGFNSTTANKLLVLIDGRSIYNPLFGGTFWQSRDVVLEDVERIEVVRGPGGAVWGANAVNGVINIITKKAKDTQGSLVAAGAGNEEKGFITARQGVELSDNSWVRIYGKYFNRDDSFSSVGEQDSLESFRSGFKYELEPSEQDSLTIQGDIYKTNAESGSDSNPLTGAQTVENVGGNAILHWERVISKNNNLSFTTWFDYTKFDNTLLAEKRKTIDLEVKNQLLLWENHNIVWGLGYRNTEDEIDNSAIISLNPDERSDDTFNLFVEDEICFDEFCLSPGSKIEHNDYTGWEVQPSIRSSYFFDADSTAWAAISRAVRIPTRLEEDLLISFEGQEFRGSENLEAESVISYEMGYRTAVNENLLFDVAGFISEYRDIVGVDGFLVDNVVEGTTHGVELAIDYKPLEQLSLKSSYTYLIVDLKTDSTTSDLQSLEKSSPEHQIALRASYEIAENLTGDFGCRYVDDVRGANDYFAADARIAYQLQNDLELAIIGQNIFDNRHREFANSTESQTSVFGKVTWSY